MRHIFSLCILTVIFTLSTLAQGSFGNGFEVHTRLKYPKGGGMKLNIDSLRARIEALPDSSQQYATFVYTTPNVQDIDSVELTLTNSQNQVVYQVTASVASLAANGQYKVRDQTLYVTPGTYPYLKHFSATLRTISNGVRGVLREFTKP